MKASYYLGIILFFSAMMLTNCKHFESRFATKEIEQPKVVDEAVAAKLLLFKARLDSIAEYPPFRVSSETLIKNYDKRIDAIRTKIEDDKSDKLFALEERLTLLDSRNDTLKFTLNDYKVESKAKWKSFRVEFEHDLKELGSALAVF
jgi:hypothetical protein